MFTCPTCGQLGTILQQDHVLILLRCPSAHLWQLQPTGLVALGPRRARPVPNKNGARPK